MRSDADQPGSSENRLNRRTVLWSLLAGAAAQIFPKTALSAAFAPSQHPDWTGAFPSYRIAGNLYYVGSRDLASFLVTTPQGHILINSNLVSSPPQIKAGIESLGFKYRDVKILLISHAHFDHCAGSAQVLRETGAKYLVMDSDVAEIEDGGTSDFRYGKDPSMYFPKARVDRVLHEGEHVQLGDTVLTAHKTAGHTKGCTTWSMEVQDGPLRKAEQAKSNRVAGGGGGVKVVVVGSPNVNSGFDLVHDPKYPGMAADFAHQFRTLKSLPCDLFLGAHGLYYDMIAKHARLKQGDLTAFLDGAGYQAYVADRQKAFEQELQKQKAAAHPSHRG